MAQKHLAGFGLALLLGACASTPTPHPAKPSAPIIARPEAAAPLLREVRFSDLPDWQRTDLSPTLAALRRQCANWANLTPDRPLGGAYGGTVGMWLPACAAAQSVAPGGERAFFESYFTPAAVNIAGGEARLTAYYEPVITASRTPAPGLTEPLLLKPTDMVTVDLAGFALAYDDSTLRGAPRALTGQLQGNKVVPYPKREAIIPYQGQIIGYANPADVYNLQVQGSGRLGFLDGQQVRAAYAAQNGYKWRSALIALRDTGQVSGATWANMRSYFDANPGAAKSVLNYDPSYIFFAEEPITDPSAGPRGAASVPLTPMGSMAVDPSYHPYGALIYVDGVYDGAAFDRLVVAQDTGGAIKRGPLRGDFFAGTGPEAGRWAERMNSPVKMWTLIPKGAPIAMLDGAARG
ncbi:MAG TPA: MltA domain-containing protein [Caulobacterales bacterium]|jgi:membrane-bound lytic murein transglycosylase A|nr:MltA domain-containing protein [Caulobacterales bacterium]